MVCGGAVPSNGREQTGSQLLPETFDFALDEVGSIGTLLRALLRPSQVVAFNSQRRRYAYVGCGEQCHLMDENKQGANSGRKRSIVSIDIVNRIVYIYA